MKVNDVNSCRELKRISHVTCDFCDEVFDNRYDSIIHNASHIIIPLLKQHIFNCKICSTYFTSTEDFDNHNSSKHPIKIEAKKIKKEIHITDVIKTEHRDDLGNDPLFKIEPIRDRLKFEDDVSISNGLIKDLVTECKVNVQLFNPPWLLPSIKNGLNKENSNNGISNGIDLTGSSINGISTEGSLYKSISYSCLVKPGIYNCKFCSKSYPNRFNLIKHETHHLKFRRSHMLMCTYCDKYIAGNYHNLHAHINTYHPGRTFKKVVTHVCKRCNLRFKRYKRHVNNYHKHDCRPCGLEFNTASESDEHKKTCKSELDKTKIKVCQLCYSFMKSKLNINYYYHGVWGNETGMRYSCEGCGKKFFELNVVKRIRKKHVGHPIQDSRQKRITNEDRLKNIQQRLKKLNLLNRFYCVVLFFLFFF